MSATLTKPAVTKPRKEYKWYNWDKIYSFNAVYNFIVGERGVGKTFGWKKKAIKDALNKEHQFMYVRRYKDELKVSAGTFFDDIKAQGLFPEWDFRSYGAHAQAAPADTRDQKQRPWKTIGHFIALSTAQNIKSVAYPLVTNIGFDEFILEKSMTRYLPRESYAFNNLYNTVDRNQDKTKVFFMANSVSIMNPYFLEYDIKPEQCDDNGFVVKANGFMVVHFVKSEEFREQVYDTRFGQFIADTEYADYAVGNEFADNNDNLLNLKNASARYTYSIETKQGIFSVWIDWGDQKYYIQERRPKQEMLFTMLPEKMTDGKTLLAYSDKIVQVLRTAFRNGNAYFDTAKTRNAFIEIFKR
ncbi:terminase [Arthrobacter phage Anjali]|uniref:Terminase n=1 Tax=Arthrobacter phage Anjali TaxID=2484217 RepID=A0A3G3LY08_9CAUD|nr:terminase [Arthrobacter phage Anjali]AYQ98986.1 terminase [Arthrobacter phage Anjali]WNT44592.1 terminase [Arthrobacter phage Tillums]